MYAWCRYFLWLPFVISLTYFITFPLIVLVYNSFNIHHITHISHLHHSTYVFGWGQAVATDQRSHISGNACFDWFSKRRVRLPINSGLYLGVYFSASNDHMESSLLGITTIYKRPLGKKLSPTCTTGLENIVLFQEWKNRLLWKELRIIYRSNRKE